MKSFLESSPRIGALSLPMGGSLLVIFGVLFYVYKKVLLPQPVPGIPYDEKSAQKLLGDFPDMISEVSQTREVQNWLLKKVHQLKEPLCQVFPLPFSTPWVLLSDSVETRNLLTRNPAFGRSNFDRTGLTHLDGFHSRHEMGDEWRRTRNWIADLVSPTFINKRIQPILYENAFRLLDFWKSKAFLANGRAFDAALDLDHVALDAMISFAFDEEFRHAALDPQIEELARLKPSDVPTGSEGEALFPQAKSRPFTDAMYTTVEAIVYVTSSLWPAFAKRWVLWSPYFSHARNVRRKVIKAQVTKALGRLEGTGEAKTSVELMLMREKKAAEKQGRKPDYYNQVLMDEVGGQFFAGFHTSSTSLSWIFIHLTRNPKVQAKLHDALHTAFSAAYAERRVPTQVEISTIRIPYLDAVLDEVLRMQATLLSRLALKDTEVFGHRIPKGTTVFMLCNGPGFHSPTFESAKELRRKTAEKDAEAGWDESRDMASFDPERWLRKKENATNDDNIEYDQNAAPSMGFGMGLRGCWGKKVAYVELRILVAMVMWHFDLEEIPKAFADPKKTLSVIHRADECFVRLRPREDASDDFAKGL